MAPEASVPAPPGDPRSREPVRLRVDYERMNSFFADYLRNIAKGGTFIKTERPLAPGTRLAFRLTVPALSEPIGLVGEVASVRSAGAEGAGMGVRFVFAGDSARRALGELVERLMEDSLGPELARRLLAV